MDTIELTRAFGLLGASFVVASRDNSWSKAAAKDAVTPCVGTYRESMAEFSRMKTLELWHCSIGVDELVANHGQRVVNGYNN